MKTTLFIFVIASCITISGCTSKALITVAGSNAASPETDLAIHELVVRNLVAGEPDGRHVLVSFGESWIDHVDPPEDFFEHLADLDVLFVPASKHDQLPTSDALLLVVRIVERTSASEASVSVKRYRFSVGASDGFTARVEWREGLWRVAKTTNHWGT